ARAALRRGTTLGGWVLVDGIVGDVARDGDLIRVPPPGVPRRLRQSVGFRHADLAVERAAALGYRARYVPSPVVAYAGAEDADGLDDLLLLVYPGRDEVLALDYLVHDVLRLTCSQLPHALQGRGKV